MLFFGRNYASTFPNNGINCPDYVSKRMFILKLVCKNFNKGATLLLTRLFGFFFTTRSNLFLHPKTSILVELLVVLNISHKTGYLHIPLQNADRLPRTETWELCAKGQQRNCCVSVQTAVRFSNKFWKHAWNGHVPGSGCNKFMEPFFSTMRTSHSARNVLYRHLDPRHAFDSEQFLSRPRFSPHKITVLRWSASKC